MQSGWIEALQIQRHKGNPFEQVKEVELLVDKGIVGDCHCGGDKQITLISSQAKHWINFQEPEGLCISRFQENIVTQGIDYYKLNIGDILITQNSKIEISAYSKRCFPECKRIQDKLSCELKIGTAFAKVLQSGNIQLSDQIWEEIGC